MTKTLIHSEPKNTIRRCEICKNPAVGRYHTPMWLLPPVGSLPTTAKTYWFCEADRQNVLNKAPKDVKLAYENTGRHLIPAVFENEIVWVGDDKIETKGAKAYELSENVSFYDKFPRELEKLVFGPNKSLFIVVNFRGELKRIFKKENEAKNLYDCRTEVLLYKDMK
jgi:hypothetical protein